MGVTLQHDDGNCCGKAARISGLSSETVCASVMGCASKVIMCLCVFVAPRPHSWGAAAGCDAS